MKSFVLRYWKLILVILIAVTGIFVWKSRAAAATSASAVTTAKAVRKDFVKTVSSSGKTKANTSADLKFQTSGKLAWVGVKEGDRVSAYQAIAGLDSRDVQTALEKTLRDYSKQRNDFEQTWRVTYDGKTPNDAFNDTVKRILEKNQWDLDKAVYDVELKQMALEYATLVTPIAGIITHIDTPVAGVNITPATAVFTVVDPDSLIFEANIDEVDIGNVSVGQPARISLDAFPDRILEGTVSAIAYSAHTSTGGATVFPVKISLPNPSFFRIGFNGDTTIELNKQPDAIVVPISAVREKNGIKFVYKKTGKTYQKTPITTGIASDDEITVTGGVTADDEIVTKGFTAIPGASL